MGNEPVISPNPTLDGLEYAEAPLRPLQSHKESFLSIEAHSIQRERVLLDTAPNALFTSSRLSPVPLSVELILERPVPSSPSQLATSSSPQFHRTRGSVQSNEMLSNSGHYVYQYLRLCWFDRLVASILIGMFFSA